MLDGFAPVRPVQDSRVVDQPRDDAVDGERPVVDRGEHGDDVLLDADVRGKGGRDAAGVDDGRDDAVGYILRSRSMVHGDRPAVAREEPAARGSDPFAPPVTTAIFLRAASWLAGAAARGTTAFRRSDASADDMRRYAPGAASACLEATADDSMTILCRSVGGSERRKASTCVKLRRVRWPVARR